MISSLLNETRVRDFWLRDCSVLPLSSSLPSFMMTVARSPERRILSTPSCILRAKLARLETPHPLPLTWIRYAVFVLVMASAASSEVVASATLACTVANIGSAASPKAAMRAVVVVRMLVFIM